MASLRAASIDGVHGRSRESRARDRLACSFTRTQHSTAGCSCRTIEAGQSASAPLHSKHRCVQPTAVGSESSAAGEEVVVDEVMLSTKNVREGFCCENAAAAGTANPGGI